MHCADGSDEEAGYCSFRTCPLRWFKCLNKKCVPQNATCDGVDDCGDSTDELNCTCSEDRFFRCKNGECVMKFLRCDSDPDCADSSDEMDCKPTDCVAVHNADFRKCNFTTNCIHTAWICDGENDCWDNSDEVGCDNVTTDKTCDPLTQWRCNADQRCIKASQRCDGIKDCSVSNCKHSRLKIRDDFDKK